MHKRKISLSFFAIGSLLVSLALAFNMFGTGMQQSFAQALSVSVTDFYFRSGHEPWGTTFDSNGNVWIALPGCDPSPTCRFIYAARKNRRIQSHHFQLDCDIRTSRWLRPAVVPRV